MSGAVRKAWSHHLAATVQVAATPAVLFDRLDDHERLAAHMMQASAMMAGNAMEARFDAGRGRKPGSRITMSGQVLGLALHLSEVVTERDPPHRKAWETEGEARLLVIGAYRMGFAIAPDGAGSRLTVFIDYDLPAWPWRLLALVAGRFYARWCVQSMVRDAAGAFPV